MDAPAFAATRLVRPALLTIAVHFLLFAISLMAMVKPANASGSVSTYTVYSMTVWGVTCTSADLAAFAACVTSVENANGQQGGCWVPIPGREFCAFVGSEPGWAYPPTSLVCPAHSTGTPATNPTSCTCNDKYQPDPFHVGCAQVPDVTCTVNNVNVNKLNPLNPAVQPYEDGLIDMANETQATREGAACIVREARARHLSPQITSGYRPPAYQTHIREVYDKWQLLQNNNDAACADTKREVKVEFKKHSKFAHQPGNTSHHSSGRAVDISLTNYTNADTIAAGCNMSKPVANDISHF